MRLIAHPSSSDELSINDVFLITSFDLFAAYIAPPLNVISLGADALTLTPVILLL
jgi:hypothetical protein